MKYTLTLLLFFAFFEIQSQSLYFPPLAGTAWETLPPDSLGWCDEQIEDLYAFLEDNGTKAFLVLKDGRMVLEKYFGTFSQDSLWYWASAGKTATAVLVGIAQAEGLLDIGDPVSDYLGQGWTSAPADKEALITVRHQLTMTSGLDDIGPDSDCTLPSCLLYLADAGTRWAYHNAPYTLLDKVVEAATGQNFNLYFTQKVKAKTGMKGLWLPLGYNNVYFSDARSMARFGLLVLNGGHWGNTPVLPDAAYMHDMVNTSQDLNLSYGYLWWLNGKDTYMVPGLQFPFSGPLSPSGPQDMISALGKNGQFLSISPSEGLIMVRMGNSPDALPVPFLLNNEIWKRMNDLSCSPVRTGEVAFFEKNMRAFPNPVDDFLKIAWQKDVGDFTLTITDGMGRQVFSGKNMDTIDTRHWPHGIYQCIVKWDGGMDMQGIVK